jgi:hypothetical protein
LRGRRCRWLRRWYKHDCVLKRPDVTSDGFTRLCLFDGDCEDDIFALGVDGGGGESRIKDFKFFCKIGEVCRGTSGTMDSPFYFVVFGHGMMSEEIR